LEKRLDHSRLGFDGAEEAKPFTETVTSVD